MNKEQLVKEAKDLVSKKQGLEQQLQQINIRLIEIQGAVKNIDDDKKEEVNKAKK